jgi:hypothetical protein
MAIDSIAADADFCELATVRSVPDIGSPNDQLILAFYKDSSWKDSSSGPVAPLTVSLDLRAPRAVARDKAKDTLSYGKGDITGRTVVIRRAGLDKILCAVAPKPALQTTARTALRTTQFIADGAVSSSLRGAEGAQSATGSLGIDHLDIKDGRESATAFPGFPYLGRRPGSDTTTRLLWRKLPLSSERLRALITIANSIDTLDDHRQSVFRQALLSPSAVGKGHSGSGSIDYQRYVRYFDGEIGPRLNFAFAKGIWTFRNTDSILPDRPRADTITASVTLVSVDTRIRWTPIQRRQDAKGNDFSFSVEFGYAWRTIAGDARSKKDFLDATIGNTRSKYSGFAGGFVINLRQVTATADLPFLRAKNNKNIEGLTGLQPIVTLNFSAPVFTF